MKPEQLPRRNRLLRGSGVAVAASLALAATELPEPARPPGPGTELPANRQNDLAAKRVVLTGLTNVAYRRRKRISNTHTTTYPSHHKKHHDHTPRWGFNRYHHIARVEQVRATGERSKKPHPHRTRTRVHPDYSPARLKWLKKLRWCESRGNYTLNTGNGFYGAYQFMDSTWDSLNTGYNQANYAPPIVQDKAIVRNTFRSPDGIASQNPGCYRSMGLRAFPPK